MIVFCRVRDITWSHTILVVVTRQLEPKYRRSGACLRLKIRHIPPAFPATSFLAACYSRFLLRLSSFSIAFFRAFSFLHASWRKKREEEREREKDTSISSVQWFTTKEYFGATINSGSFESCDRQPAETRAWRISDSVLTICEIEVSVAPRGTGWLWIAMTNRAVWDNIIQKIASRITLPFGKQNEAYL